MLANDQAGRDSDTPLIEIKVAKAEVVQTLRTAVI
jgi:hypothetical protein